MTTNKPEVKRYTPAYSVDSVMRDHLFMEESEHGSWVSLEDYEALQAECEALHKDAARYQWLCDGNGYFLEHEMLCGFENEKVAADAAIDAHRKQQGVNHDN